MKHFALVLMVTAAFAAEGYHVLNKIKIGGTGGWDYVTADGANHRLYVSHGTSIAIVDTDTGSVVGGVSELHGVHGIAIAAELNKGFISNGQSSTVTVFDLSTFAKTAEIPAGQNPDAICYEPKTGAPVPAVVELKSTDRARYTESDDKGRFVFDGLPAGDFTVYAYAPGFPAETRQLAGPKTVRMEKRACATQVLVAPQTGGHL